MRRKSGRPFRLLKDGTIAALLVVAGTLVAAKVDGLGQQRFSGRFTVVDGDTLAARDERFRLVGIDAPELKQSCGNDGEAWPCGERARDYLRSILQGGAVECSGGDRDKYDRLLVRCSVAGKDVAGEMVTAGLAVATEYFLFSQEQASAQDRRAGIWSGAFERPNVWRREHRAADMDAPTAGTLALIRHILGW